MVFLKLVHCQWPRACRLLQKLIVGLLSIFGMSRVDLGTVGGTLLDCLGSVERYLQEMQRFYETSANLGQSRWHFKPVLHLCPTMNLKCSGHDSQTFTNVCQHLALHASDVHCWCTHMLCPFHRHPMQLPTPMIVH